MDPDRWLPELEKVYKPAAEVATGLDLKGEERYHVIRETLTVAQEVGPAGVAFAKKAEEWLGYCGSLENYIRFSKQFSRIAYAEKTGGIEKGTTEKLIETGLEKLKELGYDGWEDFVEYEVLKMPSKELYNHSK